jgi:hypothetical protein
VLVQLRAYVEGGVLDRLEEHFWGVVILVCNFGVLDERKGRERRTCHSRLLNVDKMRLEHALWRLESLGADFDCAAVW